MHVALEGDFLRTQFAYAPTVFLEAVQDGPMTATMRFASSTRSVGGQISMTMLTFANVLDFRWFDFELGLTRPNPADTKFRLIEITDSETIERFRRERKLRHRPHGLVKEDDLRHFRITFDDHGTYDVICTGVTSATTDDSDRP
jgi:hypothetical protein